MKKIFIIIGSLGLGGTEKQLLMKLCNLKNYYNFTLIIFYKKGELFDEFKKEGFKIIDFTGLSKSPILKYFLAFLNLIFLLRKKRPKIVNLYLPHSYIIFGLLSYFFKDINFLMSRRSLNNYQKKIPFLKFFESRILHKKMKIIFANSKSIKTQLIFEEYVKESKIRLIYNSVRNYQDIIKKKNNKVINILVLANFIPYKNHNMIIEAIKLIPENLNFKVNLAGDGNKLYLKKLKKKIKSYKLNKKIKFLGLVKNTQKILSESDIGLLCSDEEGLSNSILEYMSYQIPIIATDVGGNGELVKNNFNGFIISKNDHRMLSLKLKKLILDKKLRYKFGKNNSVLLKKYFLIDKNIGEYKKIYDEL